jgi:hypothetical protein
MANQSKKLTTTEAGKSRETVPAPTAETLRKKMTSLTVAAAAPIKRNA